MRVTRMLTTAITVLGLACAPAAAETTLCEGIISVPAVLSHSGIYCLKGNVTALHRRARDPHHSGRCRRRSERLEPEGRARQSNDRHRVVTPQEKHYGQKWDGRRIRSGGVVTWKQPRG